MCATNRWSCADRKTRPWRPFTETRTVLTWAGGHCHPPPSPSSYRQSCVAGLKSRSERYEARGYRVLTPAYPGFEVEVEALNEDPSPIEASTIPGVVEHLEGIV